MQAAPPTISLDACARMVEAAAHCPAAAPPPAPSFDALAVSFASQASALSWVSILVSAGGIVLVILNVAGGFFWARHVLEKAKRTTRDWMDEHAPTMIADQIAAITPAQTAPGAVDDAARAEAQALGAEGERP